MHQPRQGAPELRGRPYAQHSLERVLPAVPRAAELARACVRVACRSWGAPDACDTAALVTTELVGNAVRHTRSRMLVLRLVSTARRLRIEVADSSPDLPVQQPLTALSDAGRGLWLVQGLAERWGTDPEPAGKTVWAEIALPETAPAQPPALVPREIRLP